MNKDNLTFDDLVRIAVDYGTAKGIAVTVVDRSEPDRVKLDLDSGGSHRTFIVYKDALTDNNPAQHVLNHFAHAMTQKPREVS